jgi:hypothetical protein
MSKWKISNRLGGMSNTGVVSNDGSNVCQLTMSMHNIEQLKKSSEALRLIVNAPEMFEFLEKFATINPSEFSNADFLELHSLANELMFKISNK